jgi:hypothetical protein
MLVKSTLAGKVEKEKWQLSGFLPPTAIRDYFFEGRDYFSRDPNRPSSMNKAP